MICRTYHIIKHIWELFEKYSIQFSLEHKYSICFTLKILLFAQLYYVAVRKPVQVELMQCHGCYIEHVRCSPLHATETVSGLVLCAPTMVPLFRGGRDSFSQRSAFATTEVRVAVTLIRLKNVLCSCTLHAEFLLCRLKRPWRQGCQHVTDAQTFLRLCLTTI